MKIKNSAMGISVPSWSPDAEVEYFNRWGDGVGGGAEGALWPRGRR